ncbi:MAG: nitroreductase family protein [Bacteroidales bacterium]|nr:nitroreductase family protein [Bacteroidales bacterium]
MELFEAIFNRRSVRKYTPEKVDDSLLHKIIEAGMYAPSAVNKMPWHFLIIRSADGFSAIMEANPNAGMLKQANVAILVCFDKHLQHDIGYGPVDCSAATQNMLLAAHALGLGACWIGIYPRQNRIDLLHGFFKLPEPIVPFSVISLGYANEEKKMPQRFFKDRIHDGKW